MLQCTTERCMCMFFHSCWIHHCKADTEAMCAIASHFRCCCGLVLERRTRTEKRSALRRHMQRRVSTRRATMVRSPPHLIRTSEAGWLHSEGDLRCLRAWSLHAVSSLRTYLFYAPMRSPTSPRPRCNPRATLHTITFVPLQ